jgi:hypothetical protein
VLTFRESGHTDFAKSGREFNNSAKQCSDAGKQFDNFDKEDSKKDPKDIDIDKFEENYNNLNNNLGNVGNTGTDFTKQAGLTPEVGHNRNVVLPG